MEMTIQIEVISEEIIKPSSPTPEKLRKYQLSFLDKLNLSYFFPLIYFYLPDGDDDKTSNTKSAELKRSLSEALNFYYPLAGRYFGGPHVECTDEGVPFVDAKADCSIDGLVGNPSPAEYKKLVPFEMDEPRDFLLTVQVTHFECGGISIGILLSHKIADAYSIATFANSWASFSRGGYDVVRPILEAAKIFPPDEADTSEPDTWIPKEKFVGNVLTFPASKISDLQDAFSSGGRRPSRVEALSTFIWSKFFSITETEPDPTKIHAVGNTVNFRARIDPPLSSNNFGNLGGLAIAVPSTENGRVIDGPSEVLQKIHEAIAGLKVVDYANQLKNNKLSEVVKERMGLGKKCELVMFIFTSLCRFPLYEVDFGWGKPVRVGSTRSPAKNIVLFLDTPKGDGIEAWMFLKDDDMKKFLNDPEVQNLAMHL